MSSQADRATKPTSFIAAETVSQTLHGYEKNNLYLFLRSKFGAEDALRLMKDYRVGTSKHWQGSCVFWQTDINSCVRTGKVMLYDAETGKHVKEPFNHVTWVHSLLRLPDFNLRQCFFGEHLLPMNRGKPVAIVESEILLSAKIFRAIEKIGLIPFAGVSPLWLFWCRQTNHYNHGQK